MGPSVELNPRYEIDRPRRTIQQFDKETLNKLKERRAQIQEYQTKYPDKFKLDPKTEKKYYVMKNLKLIKFYKLKDLV